MTDILDPSVLLSSLSGYLPSSKALTHPQDALAVLLHSSLSVLSFRLLGLDDSSSGDAIANNILPEGWNAQGPGNYTFKYRHDQSTLEYIVKSDKTACLDISTYEFVSPSFFPYLIVAEESRSLVNGFISLDRVADFISLLKLKIIQILVPGLKKEGYTEESVNAFTNYLSDVRLGQPLTQSRPLPGQSDRPESSPEGPHFPPGLPSRDSRQNPLQIGRSDLDPMPLHDPFSPPPLFPSAQGDGMLVGPDHPIFGGTFGPRRDLGSPGSRGPWGGDGFLPPMGAPPGARFDPVVPGPFGPGGTPIRGPGGRGSQRRSGEPDNDEFMPPGANDMFS
ncbi:hypothetical protein EW145_g145 [Phellinidium pouzarii]|uniref:Uncharacterized protein n=1 Tax=Phellinidium pouzarii TaxID=167371 RepID=A0A4S4LQ41_9AGAM|nr:hypothetical protein EW145_g145 [Phellinidium pouzarii]